MANVEYALEFLLERGRVIELRGLPVQGMARRCLETALVSSLYLSVRQVKLQDRNCSGLR
jgi:hypothetical protein